MDSQEFAKYFDHTLLKPFVPLADFEDFCRTGVRLGVKMLAVNPAMVAFCKERVGGSGVLVGAAVSFPFGQTTPADKLFETRTAITNGADEIDYVINIVELKSKNFGFIQEEMAQIVQVCRDRGVTAKAIFENCYLTQEEKRALCEIASQARPDFIKTSTGYGTGGATAEDVAFMRQNTDAAVKVKASGGIKTLDQVYALIGAGAERIGCSATAEIIREFAMREGR